MSLDIKNLSYVEQDVGQHIKSTKKHFIWEFLLEGRPHKIELYDSRISGKKKLIKDGQVWKEVEGDIAFSKSFEIGKYSCTIIQHGEKYELRIDNQSFSHLMDLEKNRVYFSSQNNPTSNSYISKPTNNNNKISFGMGQVNQQNASQKHNSLFNFSIKTQGTQKRTSEVNSNDLRNYHFTVNKDENSQIYNNTNNNTRSQSMLLDFNESTPSQIPTQNKSSTFNILEEVNFSTDALNSQSVNNQNLIQNKQNQETYNIFDLPAK